MKGKLLALDIGAKRIGVARTDALQISINPVDTFHVSYFIEAFDQLILEDKPVAVVVGWPLNYGEEGKATDRVQNWINRLSKKYKHIPFIKVDESFSSVEAKEVQHQAGLKKKKRADKESVDKIAAVVILKRYLDSI